jgi:predicted RNA binding protein YcfA (HicA-like mRNA interferase family)
MNITRRSHLSLVHPAGWRVIVAIHVQDLPRGTVSAIIRQDRWR